MVGLFPWLKLDAATAKDRVAVVSTTPMLALSWQSSCCGSLLCSG